MAQLVFVDLETTGLDVDRHGIIEIGCIFETDGQREAEDFHSLANPGEVEKSAEAAEVHKISPASIATAPSLEEVLRQFDKRCQDEAIISGWNTKFEEAFLYRAYRRHGIPWRFDYHVFDVWSLYKHFQLLGNLPADLHLGLGTVAEHCKQNREGEVQHRAFTDIEWTWRLHRLALESQAAPGSSPGQALP